MKKKTLPALLIVLITLSLIYVPAYAKDSEFAIDNGVLKRYNGPGGAVAVPDGVTVIGDSAFANFAGITSVELPDSVTVIENAAFLRCISLVSVTLPSGLTSIGDYAFESCASLAAVTIPDRVTSVGTAAFAGCKNLMNVDVGVNNTHYSSISGIMFNKTQSDLLLYPAGRTEASYKIPAGIKNIGAYAFCGCPNLTSVIIPDSLTAIGKNAFDSCRKLSSIEIPSGVKTIGDSAFSYSGLKSVKLSDGITVIPDRAFSLCKDLTSVTIPDSVTAIGNAAFQSSGLISVTIPGNVTEIGWEAFNSCPSLTSIIIPDSVKNIGNGAFYASDNVVIYGIRDSYAHGYAKQHYIKFAEYKQNADGTPLPDPSSATQTKPLPVPVKFDPAYILHKLGLFNGVGADSQGNPIFDLEREPTRQEALVMLIRLLGLEKTALDSKAKHPFDDVASWADPYVGYAYSIGLTNGLTKNKFGSSNLVSLQQYSVFLLRALGYSEKENDFTYSDALDRAAALGIVKPKDGAHFTRGRVTELSYNILLLSPKGGEKTLANKLLWEDVFTTGQLDETHDGKLMLAADMPDLMSGRVTVYNLEDLRELILLSMRNNQLGIAINVPGFSGAELQKVYDDIIDDYYGKAVLGSSATCWNNYIYPHINISDYLMLEYYYGSPARYQKNYQFYRTDLFDSSEFTPALATFSDWVKKADSIIKENTKSSMSQREKVKALHDYLILNTRYDRAAEGRLTMSPHFANQVIFEGYGVCDGYSEAFKILMNAAGIECKVIYGSTPYGPHAWNQVKIGGVWYNTDVTWDDPDDGSRITYDYYCVSDEKFQKDHKAEEICGAAACPESLNIG